MPDATEYNLSMPVASRLPPGPRAPGIVNALRYARDPLGFFARLARRHGPLATVAYPGFGRVVYVTDPELVREIFTGDPAQLHAGEANATVLEPAVGRHSILTLDDEEHLRQRRLLLPPFHGRAVARYGEVIRDATRRDMAQWPVGRSFALRPHTQAVTLDVILRAVFGLREPARLTRARALAGEFAHRSDLVVHYPFLRRDLGRLSPWARFLRARDALDAFIYEEIARRRAAPDAEERDDVLSLLLRARHEDSTPLSDRELRDELVTVLGAGHETTATALAWALERIARHPRVLERLRESLAADDEAYLDATVKETLRIRPVLPDVARKLTAPLRLAGVELPAGTMVLPAITALHLREDLFPDPWAFRPERFLEGDPPAYAWIPFGGGVRRCIGAAFAEYEMRVVLREILERADLRAADPRDERVRLRNITLAPARGARMVLERPLRAAPRATVTVAA
jgi:cytochrome P450